MCAGKTKKVIEIVSTSALVNNNKIALYANHSIDNRDGEKPFSSHSSLLADVNPVKTDIEDITSDFIENCLDNETYVLFTKISSLEELWPALRTGKIDLLAIDEGQFFSDIHRADLIVNEFEIDVVIGGLIGDIHRNKFGGILDLLPKADEFIFLQALCTRCLLHGEKRNAPFSFKHSSTPLDEQFENKEENVVEVGGSDKYMALCRECYNSLH